MFTTMSGENRTNAIALQFRLVLLYVLHLLIKFRFEVWLGSFLVSVQKHFQIETELSHRLMRILIQLFPVLSSLTFEMKQLNLLC